MLTNVKIQHFRALREIDVPLRPLTVLIGANDTGKSAFLVAIDKAIHGEKEVTQSDHWLGLVANQVNIMLVDLDGKVCCIKSPDRKIERSLYSGRRIRFEPEVNASNIRSCVYYVLSAQGVEMQSEGYPDDSGSLQLASDGSGVPSLLDYLLRRQRKRFDLIVEALRNYIPGLHEIEIATPQPSIRRLDLVLTNGLTIHADQASAGVRLLIFFIALAYHPSPPQVILLEEPENGVHPKRLAEIVSLLRDITTGKHGDQRAQVILTTHSPYLLDSIDPEVDQVLVFRRNEDGSRSADPVDTERLKVFLDEFMLGEVWYSQGEAGLVAKRS